MLIQPVLVWDDGDELQPGPTIEAKSLPLSKVPEFCDSIPAELARIEAKLTGPPTNDGDGETPTDT